MNQTSPLTTVGRRILAAAPAFNRVVTAAMNSALLGRFLHRNMLILEYTGRRSGRTFSIPVAYRRERDRLVIGANMPEAKTWWRNFLGDGGAVRVHIGAATHPGQAVATRDSRGRVTVTVDLDA